MLYQQKRPTIDAHRITSAAQAARLVPGSRVVPPRDGEHWRVEWDVPGGVGGVSGLDGDYLTPTGGSWETIPAATFEAQWELPELIGVSIRDNSILR